jgi:uncharacterized protein (TIGR02246 family)
MRSVAAVSLCAALVVGCSPQDQQQPAAAQPDAAAIRSGIEGQLAKITELFSKKDTATISSIFTDDAIWILPDASTFKGRAAIQAGAAQFFTSFDSTTNATETLDRLIVVSDTEAVSFATGKYTIWMKGKKTGEAHVNPFADQWKKGSDGLWRIAYEVNAEGVAAASATAATPAATKK